MWQRRYWNLDVFTLSPGSFPFAMQHFCYNLLWPLFLLTSVLSFSIAFFFFIRLRSPFGQRPGLMFLLYLTLEVKNFNQSAVITSPWLSSSLSKLAKYTSRSQTLEGLGSDTGVFCRPGSAHTRELCSSAQPRSTDLGLPFLHGMWRHRTLRRLNVSSFETSEMLSNSLLLVQERPFDIRTW